MAFSSTGGDGRDRLAEDAEQLAQRLVVDVERRRHVDRIAEGPEIGSSAEGLLIDPPARATEVALIALEVERSHHANGPRTGDAGQIPELDKCLPDPLRFGACTLEDPLFAIDGQHFPRDGRSERVAAEGVAIVKSPFRAAGETGE
jgi:hypothetical protein